ncbi:3-isopropylmalate dehydratase small subunit [Gallaecimonas pentaromativorans]|uniref:3-isopropylmalate dehydratase small subunit n=1 Tax=Gallaecimonas pentaromativorans TaxID=584787 RepID=A0A3N1P438_9GAMM|nr:3-isopropylmalate dehydratase small subunit [Gallaecimonas pentaromativorans]ROQ21927.1 3-isopropylmalate dehydratase small subunit [Gallaecimonas pentaromativorans]
MRPFDVETGIAAPYGAANVDTDVIMPKQFLKGIDRSGLDKGVFFDQRFLHDQPNPGFILNQAAWQQAAFLVVGPNFGCGSSREHAVWGLMQLGIRAIIGSSFAGIFFDNCQRNGLLLIELPEPETAALLARVSHPQHNRLTINLGAQRISADGMADIAFEIDGLRKAAILAGQDAIGVTLQRAADIAAFEQRYLGERPWL